MTLNMHRTLVVLRLPLSVPALIKIGDAIVAAMKGNAAFSGAATQVAAAETALKKLDDAETATKTRAKGTVPARNAARVEVVQALHALKAAVQHVADGDPEQAESLIASAAMGAKRMPARSKAGFAAKPGSTSGAVQLVARAAARRASYEWQFSTDGGKSWVQAPATLQAKTTIGGLPTATTAQFRHRAVTKGGEGDWSQVVSLLVK